jgi:hypothetical protein
LSPQFEDVNSNSIIGLVEVAKLASTSLEMYPYAFVYNHTAVWLVWCSNDDNSDVFLTNKNLPSLLFAFSKEDLKRKLKSIRNDVHWDDSAVFDFDKFWKRISNMRTKYASSSETCEVILDGFNFLYDVMHSLEKHKQISSPTLSNSIYEKLFAGCNLSSMTPQNKMYSPLWSKQELQEIKMVARKLWDISELDQYQQDNQGR